MKLIYTKVEGKQYPRFLINCSYMHGDADATTKNSHIVNDEPEVFEFVQNFKKCQKAVHDNRSYGVELKDDIPELLEQYGEWDCMSEGEYYADMSIDSITYYDPHGAEFSCKIEE